MGLFPMKHIISSKKDRLSSELQLRFLHRLSRLLANGYPLLNALETICWDKQLTMPAKKIIHSLKIGIPIDQAFEELSFHPTITSYLFFARSNGDLQASIDRSVKMFEQRLNYIKKFQQILRYPFILLVIFSILLFFLKKFVLPSFVDLFQVNSEVSSTVLFSMFLIDFLGGLCFIFVIFVGITIILWHFNKHKVHMETKLKLYRALPIYRSYLRLQTSFLFATHLSTLLKTGMSIKEVLHILVKQTKLPIIAYYSSLMAAELGRGVYITNLLTQFNFIEKQLATIFQKNVELTALERDLTAYAELLTDELHRKTMKTITLIQPVFFLVIASFIIFIYATLMWPMFQIIKTI